MIACQQADLTNGIMMLSEKRTIAIALAGALTLAGCGKPQTETQPGAGEPAPPVAADAQQPPSPDEPVAPEVATNNTLTAAAEFATKSLASPFAKADMALMESFNRALIAFQIGDYARAVTELDDLAATPDLNPAQQRAVKDLLAQALKMAPDLAASHAAAAAGAAKPETPPEFPVTVPGTVESAKNVLESPFSTADPSIKRSFARAKAAYDIGNYENALTELRDLATNNQLNFQQKYAVQALLDKTPQATPAAPAKP